MKCKIYKINPTAMEIVSTYDKVRDITVDRTIYRVLNGENRVFKDGYMYRKDEDVLIHENNTIVDLLGAKSKKDKKYEKYEYVINLINNGEGLTIPQICKLCERAGIKVCEATCRKLKKEFELKEIG